MCQRTIVKIFVCFLSFKKWNRWNNCKKWTEKVKSYPIWKKKTKRKNIEQMSNKMTHIPHPSTPKHTHTHTHTHTELWWRGEYLESGRGIKSHHPKPRPQLDLLCSDQSHQIAQSAVWKHNVKQERSGNGVVSSSATPVEKSGVGGPDTLYVDFDTQ